MHWFFMYDSENVLLNAMQIDPYLRIGEDLQLYVRLQSDLGSYGSESDQEVAKSMLSDCRTKVGINDQRVLDVIASALSNFIEVSPLHGQCDFAICFLLALHAGVTCCCEARVLSPSPLSNCDFPCFSNRNCTNRWARMY